MKVDGVLVSHWNGEPPIRSVRTIRALDLQCLRIKCYEVGDPKLVNGVDPQFIANRGFARSLGVRWTFFSLYPNISYGIEAQVSEFADVVGSLNMGEAVWFDWEDDNGALTESEHDEFVWWFDHFFPESWATYANDNHTLQANWLAKNAQQDRPRPVFHPNYSGAGWSDAELFKAVLWQKGVDLVPGWEKQLAIDVVLNPEALDRLCGYHGRVMGHYDDRRF